MKRLTLLTALFFRELKSLRNIFRILTFAILYYSVAILLINIKEIVNILSNPYTVFAKIKIVSLLLTGAPFTLSRQDSFFLVILSLLFGLNMVLVFKPNKYSSKNKAVSFLSGIITLGAAGCTSCGFSVLSLLGLGGSISLLPFRGLEFQYIALLLLGFSLLYNLNTLASLCKIKARHSGRPALEKLFVK